MTRKYQWLEIQQTYDEGCTWRGLSAKYGVSSRAIQLAILRGEFISHRNHKTACSIGESAKPKKSTMSQAARDAASKRQSENNSGGRCKWYEVSGVRVQGTWEKAIAEKLNELAIKWEKVGSSHPTKFTYMSDAGKRKRYTPDFYLPDNDLYLEVKGFWWGDDKRKMEIVKLTYPGVDIRIIEKDDYEKILRGELVW